MRVIIKKGYTIKINFSRVSRKKSKRPSALIADLRARRNANGYDHDE
jgi:hypothetical protein